MTASSMAREMKAIIKALQFLVTTTFKKAVIATDSMSTVQKIQIGMLYCNCINLMKPSKLKTISQVFRAMRGLENWTGTGVIIDQMTLNPPLVLARRHVLRTSRKHLKHSPTAKEKEH